MTAIILAWAIVATLAAGTLLGLWLGERGRRVDAQIREGKVPVPAKNRAVVVQESSKPELNDELREARERFMEEARREGFDPEKAGDEFDRMMGQVYSDQGVV